MRTTKRFKIYRPDKPARILELRPVPGSPGYQFISEGRVMYYGKIFTYTAALDKLQYFVGQGLRVEVLGRRAGRLKQFPKATPDTNI
jgi:hypothetical protein